MDGRNVALCEEGVDRNNVYTAVFVEVPKVALCEEGVDRNSIQHRRVLHGRRRPLRRGRG